MQLTAELGSYGLKSHSTHFEEECNEQQTRTTQLLLTREINKLN